MRRGQAVVFFKRLLERRDRLVQLAFRGGEEPAAVPGRHQRPSPVERSPTLLEPLEILLRVLEFAQLDQRLDLQRGISEQRGLFQPIDRPS